MICAFTGLFCFIQTFTPYRLQYVQCNAPSQKLSCRGNWSPLINYLLVELQNMVE